MIDEPWHPSSADLRGLVDGSLPYDQADLVSQHLNECWGCLEAIENVSASAHALVANLGHEKVAFQFAGEQEFAKVQEVARNMALDASGSQSLKSSPCDTISLNAPDQDTGVSCEEAEPSSDGADLTGLLRPAERDNELGRIGSYRVLKVLGEGGMGLVLEGEDLVIGRQVAIKVMKRKVAAKTVARARFLREARAAAAINHPNIVDTFMVGEDVGVTQTGTVLGTPKYMSPEQAKGEFVNHRSDLFSIGIVLYQSVSGKAPFEAKNIPAILLAVSEEKAVAVSKVAPDLDPRV